MRVVSLLPAATEIVAALGASGELVGVSHECDYPESVSGLPVLTRSRLSLPAPSGTIDESVRIALREALSLFSVDHERLAALAPELIVTQDLCHVCAVSLDDVAGALARRTASEVLVLSLRPTRLADLWSDIARVAKALGRDDAAESLTASLQARLTAIRERASGAAARPRVLTVEWLEPLMLGGTWMPDLIDIAGGLTLGALPGEAAPAVNAAEIAALEPEVVLFKPCGFSLERALAERSTIERASAAVLASGARVYVSDGNAYFNRSGPRLVESTEILAACLHPERFEDFAAKHAGSLLRLA